MIDRVTDRGGMSPRDRSGSKDGRFRPSVSMLGWALNEEQNLADYVRRAEAFLRSVSDDFELVLIDDGSTDRTWEIACELRLTRPWLKLVRNQGNRGVGYNYAHAIRSATKDYFLVQTVDWSYDITELGRSFDWLRTYDVLQGVRPRELSIRGLRRRSDNLRKGLVSIVNYLLIRALFRLPLGDYQNVTVCPTRLAQGIDIAGSSSFVNPEVLLKVWWQGASFKEIAVPFEKRTRGRGTGTKLRSILRSVRDIFRFWFVWLVLGRRPHKKRGRVVRLGESDPHEHDPRTRACAVGSMRV
jgi:glycosyltransferase involved in cell wall biosynthesis